MTNQNKRGLIRHNKSKTVDGEIKLTTTSQRAGASWDSGRKRIRQMDPRGQGEKKSDFRKNFLSIPWRCDRRYLVRNVLAFCLRWTFFRQSRWYRRFLASVLVFYKDRCFFYCIAPSPNKSQLKKRRTNADFKELWLWKSLWVSHWQQWWWHLWRMGSLWQSGKRRLEDFSWSILENEL